MDLKETLQRYRKRQGLSQIELAEALDVSRQTISKWETGTALPSAENLLALSKLYGVSVDALLNGTAAEPVQEAVPEPVPVPAPPEPKKLFRHSRLLPQMLGALLLFDALMFWVECSAGFSRTGFVSMSNFFSPLTRWLGCFLIGLFFAWRDRPAKLNRKASLLVALAALSTGVYVFLFPPPLLWRLYDLVAWIGSDLEMVMYVPWPVNPVSFFLAWTLFEENVFISHCLLIAAFQLGRLWFSRRAAPIPQSQPV